LTIGRAKGKVRVGRLEARKWHAGAAWNFVNCHGQEFITVPDTSGIWWLVLIIGETS